MSKPCERDHPATVEGCRVCWLAENDVRYQRIWGLAPFLATERVERPQPVAPAYDCIHLGQPTGETVECPSCGGNVKVKLFQCGKYGECTLAKNVNGVACCGGSIVMSQGRVPCPGFQVKQSPVAGTLKWAYGVTTVPERRGELLPRTLASLKSAGFDSPRLFVDGDKDVMSWEREFGLEVTTRHPVIRPFGNWVLALAEIYIREPNAERYAIFQDDLVTYRNLRAYLDRCSFPETGYWNLYTMPSNQGLADGEGWYLSYQHGRGAVGLVFSREGVQTLLSQRENIIDRPVHPTRGWRAIDGGVVDAYKKIGWKEYVHNPTLLQHTGIITSMDKRKNQVEHDPNFHRQRVAEDWQAISFRGEDFDALTLHKDVGLTAYDVYSEPRRSQLVEAWRAEIEAVRRAVQEDEERLRAAAGKAWVKLKDGIQVYRKKLAKLERNDPPYVVS